MKKLIVALCIIAVVVIGFFGYLIVSDMKDANDGDTTSTTSIEEMRESTSGTVTEEQAKAYKEQGLNPFGQQKTSEQLTDADYQEYIHGMSHQKVKADQKWGFYQITSERILWLLDELDHTELNHKETYRQILEKWANGDFSSADDDHNTIWELQGGTIGRATGILSPEEEEEYIQTQR